MNETYKAAAYYKDGGKIEVTFKTERAARVFCDEEVKWETTQRVVCPQIGFDQRGDFATN